MTPLRALALVAALLAPAALAPPAAPLPTLTLDAEERAGRLSKLDAVVRSIQVR